MKQRPFRIGVVSVFALMVCAARPALALWVQMNVTANGVYGEQQITVKVTDREQFKQFEVTLAPKPKAVSPFLTGQLSMIAGDRWVASVPVSEKRENGVVTYTFRVTPDAVMQSSFAINAGAYAPPYSRAGVFDTAMLGKQKVQQVMGGTVYELKLKDLSPVKAQ
jgi:hypothetical protein